MFVYFTQPIKDTYIWSVHSSKEFFFGFKKSDAWLSLLRSANIMIDGAIKSVCKIKLASTRWRQMQMKCLVCNFRWILGCLKNLILCRKWKRQIFDQMGRFFNFFKLYTHVCIFTKNRKFILLSKKMIQLQRVTLFE